MDGLVGLLVLLNTALKVRGASLREKYKVLKLSIRVNLKLYRFLLRYVVLTAAVVTGCLILWFYGHKEYTALLGAGGVARALEIAGEAAADALDDFGPS